jgi:predicted ArsR family transcriptional regulator
MLGKHGMNSDDEKFRSKIIAIIKAEPKITHSKLLQKMKTDAWHFGNAINTLKERNQIEIIQVKKGASGRPGYCYVLTAK